jgi:hypothetical protein
MALIFGYTIFGMDAKELGFGAAGWMQYGQIARSSDTAGGFYYNGRASLSTGAQIVMSPKISDRLSLMAGVGVGAGHALPGPLESQIAGGSAPMGVGPYVAQANFTYNFRDEDRSKLFLRGGLFPYGYSSDAQNLGLYLLRGSIYPGFVLSGFETKYVLPVANTLGFQLHHEIGVFRHDLLVTVETDFFPFYDLSPAYVASYGFGSAFRMGAGVNFYHLFSMDPILNEDHSFQELYHIDTTGGIPDTTFLTFRGTKFMANFSFDPKAFFGDFGVLGPDDLKLYGEAALIGLVSDLPSEEKVYRDSLGVITGSAGIRRKKVYEDIFGDNLHRMPMMIGFNLPAFKLLDRLGLEVEWYGSQIKDDLAPYNHFRGSHPKPKPANIDTNYSRDNWKWSLNGTRMLNNHIKVSLQAASDHYRPGVWAGYGDNRPAGSQVLFRSPTEWYWMTKIAYFF